MSTPKPLKSDSNNQNMPELNSINVLLNCLKHLLFTRWLFLDLQSLSDMCKNLIKYSNKTAM